MLLYTINVICRHGLGLHSLPVNKRTRSSLDNSGPVSSPSNNLQRRSIRSKQVSVYMQAKHFQAEYVLSWFTVLNEFILAPTVLGYNALIKLNLIFIQCKLRFLFTQLKFLSKIDDIFNYCNYSGSWGFNVFFI